MKTAILCLAIVAYGDSSDYIPVGASSTERGTQPRSTFDTATKRSSQEARSEARRRQGQLDARAFKTQTSLPEPLSSPGVDEPVQRVGTTAALNAAGTVSAAQYQAENTWPNRPVSPTDVDSRRPPSISGANANQRADSGQSQNRRGRYIPANVTESTQPRPQYASDDTSSPFPSPTTRADTGQFGFDESSASSQDLAPPRSLGDTPFNVDDLNSQYRQRELSPSTVANYPQDDQRQTTPFPQPGVTTPAPVASTSVPSTSPRTGSNYLPPETATQYGQPTSPVTPHNAATPLRTDRPYRWTSVAQNPTESSSSGSKTATPGILVPDASQPSALPYYPTSTAATTQIGLPDARSQVAGNTQTYDDRTLQRGGFMTLLALFGSIGLNLYLGWIAWDTYVRYQDLVADIRYTSPRREPVRDEYVERVA